MRDTLSGVAQGARDAIVAYIRAKDENRPYLIKRAFAEAATLNMIVNTEAISFPPGATGREAIADVLVRGFGHTYENVRTFCLSSPPEPTCTVFSCDWLVGMSMKENRAVRVGCGQYDWTFQSQSPHLAERLTITIDVMQLLSSDSLFSVMDWLDQLPYPWCSRRAACEGVPELEGLLPISHWLSCENA
jgi:hypothetical protein